VTGASGTHGGNRCCRRIQADTTLIAEVPQLVRRDAPHPARLVALVSVDAAHGVRGGLPRLRRS